MLNRHFYRARVLESIYAYMISGETDILAAKDRLIESIEKLNDLHIYLISSMLEIQSMAFDIMEEAKQKYFPTEEDKNPNLYFVNNAVLVQIANNEDYKTESKRLKINWAFHRDILLDIYNGFRKSKAYAKHIESENSYESDKSIIISLLRNHILRSEQLFDIIIEKDLAWETYYEIVAYSLIGFVKDYKEDDFSTKKLRKVFDNSSSMEDHDDDRDMVEKIFTKVLEDEGFLDEIIQKRTFNWEIERIPLMDMIIIKMGLVELMYCPSIPVRVTLNEHIELAKEFSTEKSRIFVNGILDKLTVDLKVMGKIKKTDESIECL